MSPAGPVLSTVIVAVTGEPSSPVIAPGVIVADGMGAARAGLAVSVIAVQTRATAASTRTGTASRRDAARTGRDMTFLRGGPAGSRGTRERLCPTHGVRPSTTTSTGPPDSPN